MTQNTIVPNPRPENGYVWERCLNIARADSSIYLDHFNPKLLEVMGHAPRTLLDIGCGGGLLGKAVKLIQPACRTIGIEPNPAAAAQAAQNLDQVLHSKYEDIDFAAAGIDNGSIDTLVAADVLEHMYDPWRVMVSVKSLLSQDAQVILSIPNARHLGLVTGLLDQGAWTYAEKGLLDITHIRFFTLKEIADFASQTGYRIERVNHFLDHNYAPLFEQSKHKAEINIRSGRVSLERLTLQELAELCTWQFFIRARPIW